MFDNQVPQALVSEVASECQRKVSPDFFILVDELRSKFGDSLDAILLYGSCLRTQSATGGVVDLYLVVNSYKDFYQKSYLQYLNALLPPNVFYMEVEKQGIKINAKYAVISQDDLKKGTQRWFQSYIWSRFAQPVRMLYARDDSCRGAIYNVLAHAILRFLRSSLPTINGGVVNAEKIWINGLSLTYATEFRLEEKNRARHLVHQNLGDYIRLTEYAAECFPDLIEPLSHGDYKCLSSDSDRRRALLQWRIRSWQGSVLTIIRLMKATFTFRDCIDYAAWKIKRHTDISIQVTPELKRHPILYGLNIFWRLVRRGALR